jgi:hypothetical protein
MFIIGFARKENERGCNKVFNFSRMPKLHRVVVGKGYTVPG